MIIQADRRLSFRGQPESKSSGYKKRENIASIIKHIKVGVVILEFITGAGIDPFMELISPIELKHEIVVAPFFKLSAVINDIRD